MNYLWIDLWNKKCWLAINLEGITFPYKIVSRHELISEIKKIIKEKNIWVIIVGLPYDLYWTDIKQLNKTQNFIKKIKNIFPDLIIEWIDERFTSLEAQNILFEKQAKKEEKKDAISAYLILESYLNKKKNSN